MGHPAGRTPTTTPQWNSAPRSRTILYLLVALALAALAGVLTFLYLDQIRQESVATGQAVVARREIRPGTIVRVEMIEVRPVPEAILPEAALEDPGQVVGRAVTGLVVEGEPLLQSDLAAGGRHGLSSQLPDGRWAMVLPAGWLVSPLASLQEGDRVDLLAYQQGQAAQEIGIIAESVEILSLPDGEDASQRVTLAVSLEQASSILYAHTNGFQLLGLLRAQGG